MRNTTSPRKDGTRRKADVPAPGTLVKSLVKDRVEVFRWRDGGWGWRRVAGNGQIVAVWGESSQWKSSAKRSALQRNPGLAVTVIAYQPKYLPV